MSRLLYALIFTGLVFISFLAFPYFIKDPQENEDFIKNNSLKDGQDFESPPLAGRTIGEEEYIEEGDEFSNLDINEDYLGYDPRSVGEILEKYGFVYNDSESGTPFYCAFADREIESCGQINNPVCGWVNPEFKICSDNLCVQPFASPCEACQEEEVFYWTSGDCPLYD